MNKNYRLSTFGTASNTRLQSGARIKGIPSNFNDIQIFHIPSTSTLQQRGFYFIR